MNKEKKKIMLQFLLEQLRNPTKSANGPSNATLLDLEGLDMPYRRSDYLPTIKYVYIRICIELYSVNLYFVYLMVYK